MPPRANQEYAGRMYSDQFADKVVAIVGPAVSARMQNMAHNAGAATKKLKAEQDAGV